MDELKLILALADRTELEYFLDSIRYARKQYGDATTLATLEKACEQLAAGEDPWKARTPLTVPNGRITYFTGQVRRLWKQTGDK